MINYNITLSTNNAVPVDTGIVLKSGDKGITLNYKINELDLDSATKARFVFYRANGTSVEYETDTVSEEMEYVVQGNELAVPGKTIADVKFYDADDNRISSTSFAFEVSPDTLDGIGEGAGGYSDRLEELTEELEELTDELEATLEHYQEAFPNFENASTLTSSTKDVVIPSNVIDDASINMLGGMSRKGKNLLNPTLQTTTSNGVTCTRNSDGTYTLNGTATAQFDLYLYTNTSGIECTRLVGCSANGGDNKYKLYAQTTAGYVSDTGSGVSFNASVVSVFIRIYNGFTFNNLIFKPMLTTDTSATYNDYEPYTSSLVDAKVNKVESKKSDNTEIASKSIPSPVLALDGYGIGINNTCYNYLEWADDKVYFHKRVGSVDLGSLYYTYVSSWRGVNLFYRALTALSEPAKFGGNALIAKYEIVNEPQDKACYYCSGYISGTSPTFGVSDSTYTDAASFKSSMNGVILYYELETEVVTDVTSYFDADFNSLEVEASGTISFRYTNDDKYDVAVPSELGFKVFETKGGTTAARGNYLPVTYQTYYDTTLNKLLVYNGSNWVDANGQTV